MLWSLFAWLTIITAVVLVALRLTLPMAAQYKDQIVQAVSHTLGQPIRVASLEPEWRGLGPVIVFRDLQLLDKSGARPMLRFAQARVGIDLLRSLLHWRIEDSYLTVSGVDIVVVRHADDAWGIEGFGAMKTGGDTGQQNRAMVQQWLEAQRRIRILDSDIYWRDERPPGRHMHFAQVDLELRNDSPSHHVLSGSVVLPRSLGHTLNLVVSFSGPLLETGRWRGRVYVDGSGLNMTRLLSGRRLGDVAVNDGLLDIRAWGDLAGGRLQGLEGKLQMHGVDLDPTARAGVGGTPAGAALRPVHLTAVAGRFHWRRIDHGWIVDADRFWMAKDNAVTPQTQFRVYARHQDDNVEVEAQIGYVRLEDMTAFLELSDKVPRAVREAADTAKPRGELYHTYIHLLGRHGAPLRRYLYTQFVDLGIDAPWHGVPAVTGLDGVVQGTPAAGEAELNSQSVALLKGDVFRDTLSFDQLKGRLAWRTGGGDWRLGSERLTLRNSDISVRARFLVEGGRGRSRPFVDAVADFSDGDIAHAARYLPAGKMRPHAVAWLDRALVNGKVTSGALLLHGDLSNFPFDHHDGQFQVRFNVEHGILDFSKDWPRIEDIQTQVVFDGRGMSLEASQGKILASSITQASAHIADLTARPPLLTIDGSASGPTRDALRIVTETPLEKRIGKYLVNSKVNGDSRLSLSLKIPLKKSVPNRVSGKLTLEDSKLAFPEKIELTGIDGDLNFTNQGVKAQGIRANILGYPATLSAGTLDGKGEHGIYFAATGRTDAEHIRGLKFLDLPILSHLAGSTRWHGRLSLHESPGKRAHVVLQIDSNLKGMGIDLPAPLTKAKQDKVMLALSVDGVGTDAPPIAFHYGKRLSGVLVTRGGASGGGIDRAEFRFGDGVAALPQGHGIYITGKIDRLSVKAWRDYLQSGSGRGARGAGGDFMDRLAAVDVKVNFLNIFDWPFHHVSLRATPAPNAWEISVVSDELAGEITLPNDADRPRLLDLEYLRLRPALLRGKKHDVDPTQFQPIRLTSKQFSYEGRELGRLSLDVSAVPQGVHVDRLTVDSDTMKISAVGDWLKDSHGQVSAFTATIDSDDIGDSLSKFGYVGTIKGGKGSGQVSAVWSGSPASIDMKTLDGAVSLNLTKGRLLEVDPGAGRILGILSLQALPRRLTLDFSDLFGKGFSFDSIKGNFAVHQGNAYTDNLVMEGLAAQVKTEGRVGLAAQDYDETVTVTPHLTSSLPVAVGIASGVVAGAAILLLQKIFEDQINEMTRVQYTITGPWSKPVVERLVKGEKPHDDKKS